MMIKDCLSAAIESWRTLDRTQALSAQPQEAPLRAECGVLYEKLSQLTSASGGTTFVDLMLKVTIS